MYIYSAKIARVIDGDTVVADIDLGFGIVFMAQPLRLFGIDAPEIGTPEGKISKDRLAALINDKLVTIHTTKDKKEKYGRYLAKIFLFNNDGTVSVQSVNEWLVLQGLAVAKDF